VRHCDVCEPVRAKESNRLYSRLHQKGKRYGGFTGMAAFCSCCGAEITLKAEACPVCGTPRHGMPKADVSLVQDAPAEPADPDAKLQRFCAKYAGAAQN
jgi:predicted amidophosphoribosyltransferase